jgi:uncharacterized membrane protein YwaF
MWCPSHYFTIPIAYAVIVLLAILSRRMSPAARTWTARGIVLLLLCSELVKQLIGAFADTYTAVYLPFHYSTTFYFSAGLYAFGRGRVKHYGGCALFVGGFLLFCTLTVSPYSTVGDTAYLFQAWYNVHSYFFHMLMLLIWASMIANLDYRVKRWDELRYASFMAIWAACAIPASRLKDFNYAGLRRSFLPFLEKLRLACGDAVYLIVYALAALVVAIILIRLYALLLRHLERRNKIAPAEIQYASKGMH